MLCQDKEEVPHIQISLLQVDHELQGVGAFVHLHPPCDDAGDDLLEVFDGVSLPCQSLNDTTLPKVGTMSVLPTEIRCSSKHH